MLVSTHKMIIQTVVLRPDAAHVARTSGLAKKGSANMKVKVNLARLSSKAGTNPPSAWTEPVLTTSRMIPEITQI